MKLQGATDAPAAVPEVGDRSRRMPGPKWLTVALRAAVTLGVLGYLLHRAGLSAIASKLESADLSWLLVGYGLAALSILATVLQWWRLLGACGLERSFRRTLHFELAGDVFDAALPTSVGGDVLRATFAADSPAERPASAGSVVLRRICNFPGMVAILILCVVLTAGDAYSSKILPYSLVAALIGGAAVAVTFSPLLGRLAEMRHLHRNRGTRFVSKVLGALDTFRHRRGQLARAALRGLVFWGLAGLSQWAFMRAVHIHVPLVYGLLVVTTTTAITMLPISLGGYGIREGSFSAFLAVAGMATVAQGVAVGICLTAQTVFLGVLGIPFYLRLQRGAAARAATPTDTPEGTPAGAGVELVS
jgi:uncharacterized protein (TIRG00374 family)